ncbi:translation initiation factor eIF-2B subunit gamma [Diprion similis]|uniref:translation initiation factor eIF-2B subunit gamma n=1 Tax=Diprion similis TaxID=362088 RepID=UPI001EF935BB|nr:translation initiation factor eIF-2B subunit gamma [Diprion similis]
MWHRKEFQAVVLAGSKGSRMTELTAGRAKCLLPIGNFPMIFYPLKLLECTGFMEVIVVAPEDLKNEIASAIEDMGLRTKIDLVGIPGGDDLGTADILRSIHEKFYTDVVVVSCDLVTCVDLTAIFDSYRTHSASITALLFQVPTVPDKFINPGPRSKVKPEKDLIGIDKETGRLIFLASASDFEETINISRKLYKKHMDFQIHSKLLDAHLYVIRKWVLDYLVTDKSISSIKGELLPYIIKKQLAASNNPKKMEKNTSIIGKNTKKDVFQFAMENPWDKRHKPLCVLIAEMSAFNDHSTNLESAYNGDLIKCYAVIESNQFGARANNVQMYALANKIINEDWFFMDEVPLIKPSEEPVIKSNQVVNCRINKKVVINEKTSLKDTYIDTNSVIETKTRVLNSILMENVVIKEGCVISNCILCNDSVVEKGCELNHCIVGANHTVPAGSRYSDEVLTDIDNLMEI